MDTAGPVSVTDHAGEREACRSFRQGLYGCLTRRADASFELADTLVAGEAVATAPPPHLSLEPAFRRGWGSTHGALRRGRISEEAVRDLLAAWRPADWPAVFAVDASSWARCAAECSPERGYYHHPSRHSNGQPIVAGWNYSWIAQLNWERSSWTAPLDVRRIGPTEDAGRVTAAQVEALVGRLGTDGPVPLFVFDAGYDPIALSVDLADTRAQVLVRIRSDRVFFTDPTPPPPGRAGRPRRHGERFACADPASWPAPEAALTTSDARYGRVEVQAWSGLHPRLARRGRWAGNDGPPIVRGTVIRVAVEHLPKPTVRALKTLWLWWSGPGTPDLDSCWRAYIHRFDIEHTLRFAKHTLGWTTPRVRLPEQADRWTWLVVAAYTQLPSPGASWPTADCPGSPRATRTGSPRPASAGVSADWCRSSAPRPEHRNPPRLVPGAPRAVAADLRPATRRSRRPPDGR